MSDPIRILFFSDTHLGFDFPIHPRVERRRRGDDFFSNYNLILNAARDIKADLVIHGGDLFFRSKIPPLIIDKAYRGFLDLANAGVPIYLVPGNHERSSLPSHLWLTHENIYVFDQPKTFLQTIQNTTIALSGFPFTRNIASEFISLISQTDYLNCSAEIRYLCLHQTFEGAKVGPKDFTFRSGPDNIPGSEIPPGFSAVLSGHIHRGQQLSRDLDDQPLPAPIIYPGSIERTSIAERLEEKYYVVIEVSLKNGKPLQKFYYHQLPTRPMVKIEISTQDPQGADLKKMIHQKISVLEPDSIVRIYLKGPHAEKLQNTITAPELRKLAPITMNISLGNQIRFK